MKTFDEEKLIKKELDTISHAGEKFGEFLRTTFTTIKRFAWILGILTGVGLLVFLWSIFMGFRKKS